MSTAIVSRIVFVERYCPACEELLDVWEVLATVGVNLLHDGLHVAVCEGCQSMSFVDAEIVVVGDEP